MQLQVVYVNVNLMSLLNNINSNVIVQTLYRAYRACNNVNRSYKTKYVIRKITRSTIQYKKV